MNDTPSGFTPATFDFLRDLRAHNARPWFEANKSRYRNHVLQPLQTLAAALGPAMEAIDPEIEIAPDKVGSRIHRDTRFAKDKSPYKTKHWITFKRPRSDWPRYPAFFFEISPEHDRYGMGFFRADRDTMVALRERIEAEPAAFRRCIAFHTVHIGQGGDDSPFAIEGDPYKRPLKAGLPSQLNGLADWFHRKNLYVVRNRTVGQEGIGPGLKDDLIAGFQTLAPLYHFLTALPRR